ncbi:restriction endonuclease subunit S [Muribaculaceae bacterium Isolate-007 (NCI)]|nr:restriction endonuclease subunit S [Muribaculaceae bacterium Isolate-100 (HZI)]RXE64085.1 restriction endonuclease subunit S [Muribaculaceae bacterium Isolate-007 (NCI)]
MEMKTVRIGDLYTVSNGLSKGKAFFGSGFPFLTFSEVMNNFFVPEKLTSLVQTDEKERDKFSIKRGDVFLNRTSETAEELGISCVALQDHPNATFNGFCKRLRPIADEVVPEYIGYYLRSKVFRKHMLALTGSMITRASLRNEQLTSIEIQLPSKEIQVKIANILRQYDLMIANCKKQIALLEEAAQRLYREWFVDMRFPGHENVSFQNGYPIDWSEITLNDITSKFATGLNPRKNFVLGHGHNYYVTIKNLTSTYVVLDEKCDKIDDDAITKINKRSDLRAGDLLFSGIGTIGRVALIYEDPINWNISESLFTLRPNERVSSEFLYLLLLDSKIQGFAQANSQGSAQKGIRMAALRSFKLYLPSCEILKQFDSLVKPYIEQLKIVHKLYKFYSESRCLLLPRLISGEIKIDA